MKAWVIKNQYGYLSHNRWCHGKLNWAGCYPTEADAKDLAREGQTVVPVEIKLIKQKGK